jgi:hypothetical protein
MKTHDEVLLDFLTKCQRRDAAKNHAEALVDEIGPAARNALRILLMTPVGEKDLRLALGIFGVTQKPKQERDLRDPYRKQVLDLREFRSR